MSSSSEPGAYIEHGEPKRTHAAEARPEQLKTPTRPSMQSRNSGMNGPLYMQTSSQKVLIRRVKRKGDGSLKNLSRWFLDNQAGLSFNLLALLFLTHICMPKARPYTSRFFTLSHLDPATGKYSQGEYDHYFIIFCITLFTGLRAGCMEHVLAPLAKAWGISKRKDITRFSEQAWLLVYYLVLWPLGYYLYQNSPYFLDMQELWTNWPTRAIDGTMKVYILSQWAFWLQQILVIHIEERRKDHWQMLTHHFITVALISSSYTHDLYRVGHLILLLMDIVDIFLPLGKCLKYLGYTTLCDYILGLFVISWFLARHVGYLMVCWSIYNDLPNHIPDSCYRGTGRNLTGPFPIPNDWSHWWEPFTNPKEGLLCWSNGTTRWAFLGSLLFLQAITIAWFSMIVRLVVKVLSGGSADDPRSDDEAGEDEVESEYEEAQLVEEEVGVESLDLKGWERRSGVKRASSSTGVSLPGHSDRKELLGRIGCEKQVD